MAGSNPIIISIFILYCIIAFTIGLWAKKSTNTMAEFFVSKRDFGVLATGVTYYATAQSSSAFLGMVGWAYAFGWASSNYVSVPIAVGGFLTWALLSWRIKDLSSKIQGLTVPDLIYWRFPMKSVRLVALLIIIIAYIPMMTAQIRGVGFLFQSIISDISFGWAAFIGTVIVLIYVMLGGMKAAAYTSVLQGFFMIFSVVVLTVASLSAVGGFTEMNLQAAAIDPGYTGLTGVGGSWGPMYSLSFILLFLLSPLGQPAYLAKFFAMKDLNVARLAMPISYTFVLIASFAFPIIGLCARILYPDLPNPDAAYTVITTSLLHPVLAGIVLVSLFAAVMSTIDAILLTISSAFVRDLYEQVMGKTLDSKTLLRISVVVTVVVAALGLVLAINSPSAIMTISAAATGLLGASFFMVAVGGIYTRKLTSQGALASMLAGFFGTLLSYPGVIVSQNILNMHSFIWGLLASIVVGVVVTMLTKEVDVPEMTEALDA